ncbi:MAG: hypothetical protein HY644_10970 [Acidobacteria bacterium]|nr:hypothetical protein [Acidobacteriota bacterium]
MKGPAAPKKHGKHDRLVLGSWNAPRNLGADYFQLLADLKFTHTLYWRSPEINPIQWQRDLDRAQQFGIHLIFDSWQPSAIPSEWLDMVLKTACSHPAFAGVYAPDEPGYRFPLENPARKPHVEEFRAAYEKIRQCAQAVLFQVDASDAEEIWVRRFLPFSTVFGLDIYPYPSRTDWKERVRRATRQAATWADKRPVWMVLQGHGRADWYNYATHHLQLKIPEEKGERPPVEVLLEMAETALASGASGIWWWSFELYDWRDSKERQFILQFREVNRKLRGK